MNKFKVLDINEISQQFPEIPNKIRGIAFKNAVEIILNYLEEKHFPVYTLFTTKEGVYHFVIKIESNTYSEPVTNIPPEPYHAAPESKIENEKKDHSHDPSRDFLNRY
jgi:hypothetical protein